MLVSDQNIKSEGCVYFLVLVHQKNTRAVILFLIN